MPRVSVKCARVVCLLVLLLAPAIVQGQAADRLNGNTYAVTDLGSGVFTLTWSQKPGTFAIGNSTFIVGDDDVIVVDSGFYKATAEAILDALRQVTSKPVTLVVNTHSHLDHVFGNQVFRAAFPSVRFVAHPATREGVITDEIATRDARLPKTLTRIDELSSKPARSAAEEQELRVARMQVEAWDGDFVLPDFLVDSSLTVMQGKREVRVIHLGQANTKGDMVVHLPAERIVISGDMAITPVPFAFSSSPRQWIETLERLEALDAAVIVPGHGPVQKDRRFIADLRTMLGSVVEQVDAGMAAGQTIEELRKSVKVSPPPGSVYEKVSAAALDQMFRLPAIESAFKEKR